MPARACVWITFTLLAAAPLRAQSDPPPTVNELDERLKKLETKDSERPTAHLTGTVQPVNYWFGQTAANQAAFGPIENAPAFRRLQLGAFGEWRSFDYKFVLEFARPTTPQLRDAFGRLNDLPIIGSLAVGNIMEPFGLERISSNRYLSFIERGAIASAFAPTRNIGLLAADTFADERGTWALGVFRGNANQPSDDTGERFGTSVTGRLTVLPIWEDDGRRYLHLGVAGSARATTNEEAQFRARPEASLASNEDNVPFFVDTGPIAARYFQLGGLEFLATRGPLSLQAEYNFATVDAMNSGTLFLQGGYVFVSWLLTGEHRPYDRKTAVNTRVVPFRDFPDDCGPGAWELAARVTYLNLNSGPVAGGQLVDYTLATTWYLNAHFRATFNYIYSQPSLGGSANIYGIRFGYDF